MDQSKAAKIRTIIRLLGCVCGVGAAATALIFGFIPLGDATGLCMVSRVLAIIMFVIAIAVLVFDLIAKAFSPLSSLIGAGIGLIGFIGNFIIAPASTYKGVLQYALTHMESLTEVDTTQLSVGRYMIIFAGVVFISHVIKCFKSGT